MEPCGTWIPQWGAVLIWVPLLSLHLLMLLPQVTVEGGRYTPVSTSLPSPLTAAESGRTYKGRRAGLWAKERNMASWH